MTIKELIEQLQQLDPETHVFVKGYEGGLDYAELQGPIEDIMLNVHSEWWYGSHAYVTEGIKTQHPNNEIVKGIVL